MKRNDFIWGGTLLLIVFLLIYPVTHEIFVEYTGQYPIIGGFSKFAVLATMGELLGIRLTQGVWKKPAFLKGRIIIWGIIGALITIVFPLFNGGVKTVMEIGLLPFKGSKLALAFFTSVSINLIFGPVFMFAHKVSDTWLDITAKNNKTNLEEAINEINLYDFVSFICGRTIPFFWIPAHTVVFLLPKEYQVLLASFLGIALGVLLALANKRKMSISVTTNISN
jgi:hypothetical protein